MIARRSLIAGLPAVAATALLPRLASAGFECATPNSAGTRTCTAGVRLGNVETARQLCENWCWAACIQAVFGMHGREVAQLDVVRKVFGNTECSPATTRGILGAINDTWIDRSGARFRAKAELLDIGAQFAIGSIMAVPKSADLVIESAMKAWATPGAQAIVAELEAGNPLILFRGPPPGERIGHIILLTAATYVKPASGGVTLKELTIRDPAPGTQNRRTMSASEALRIFQVAKVWVD